MQNYKKIVTKTLLAKALVSKLPLLLLRSIISVPLIAKRMTHCALQIHSERVECARVSWLNKLTLSTIS